MSSRFSIKTETVRRLRPSPHLPHRVYFWRTHLATGTINFREFLTGLSVFCPSASHAEKLRFSFEIYDKNRDGSIAKAELQEMLESTLVESSSGLSKHQVAALIEATFLEADVNGDGEISFDE